MEDRWLKGKVIVIMGGTTGLGLAAAIRCADHGASVLVVGIDPDKTDEARQVIGRNAQALCADAASEATADKAFQAAVSAFGQVDGLYHVAGGSGRRFGDGPLHDLTAEGWDRTLHWNLDSLMFSNRSAVRHFMQANRPGTILNMSSVLGYSPSPGHFATHAYAAAKSAVIGFSRSLAAYYAQHDIRVNVIAPGLVETPMSQRAFSDEQIMHYIRTKQPLRKGDPIKARDVAETAVYLLSDRSSMVTGQVIAVDGGWTVSEGQYA